MATKVVGLDTVDTRCYVVLLAGQRLMQAASDIFLGWFRGPTGWDFYWRQLRDMTGSAKIERM